MGTSKSSVLATIDKLNQDILEVDKEIADLRKQFSGMINP
jgi:regulator of replication initiation timing